MIAICTKILYLKTTKKISKHKNLFSHRKLSIETRSSEVLNFEFIAKKVLKQDTINL